MSESCDECYTLREERYRTARKVHRCCACRREIAVGDRYCNVFTLFDGSTKTYKRCGACQRTHEHLVKLCESSDGYDDMWPREDLGCGLRYEDEWGELPPEVAALAFLTNAEASALLEGKK